MGVIRCRERSGSIRARRRGMPRTAGSSWRGGVAEAIGKRCALPADLDVLDFDCGTGLVSLALRPLVRSVTGVDTPRGMLDVFERKVIEQGLAVVPAVLVLAVALIVGIATGLLLRGLLGGALRLRLRGPR